MKTNENSAGKSGAMEDEVFTAEEIAENHERFIKRKDLYSEFGVDQEGLRARLVRQLDAGNRTILEIGTGHGYLTTMLARDFSGIVSVDTDAEGQRIAKLNAAYNGTLYKTTFITGDAGSLPFLDGSFDAVLSAFTFHHLVYPFRVIREMIRVAGRQIIVSDFTTRGFETIARIHASEGGSHNRGTADFDIVGIYLREHGFDVSMIEDKLQILYVARR